MWKPLLLISMLLPAAALPMAWRVEREPGDGPGTRACAVVALTGEVRVRLTEAKSGGAAAWAVWVGVDNQPGSLRYLRVGKRIFQTAEERFDGAEAASTRQENSPNRPKPAKAGSRAEKFRTPQP